MMILSIVVHTAFLVTISLRYKFPCHKIHPLKMCNLVVFLIYSQCCTTITTAWFQNIFVAPKQSRYPILWPLAIANLHFVSVDFPLLDVSYKWNHALCGLLWLASFLSLTFSRFIHVAACVLILCLSIRPNTMPLYGSTTVAYPFIHWETLRGSFHFLGVSWKHHGCERQADFLYVGTL